MKSKLNWDLAITKLTMEINENYPELSKYIEEIPIHNSSKSKNKTDVSSSVDYYNSLKEMLETYSKTHTSDLH